MRRYVIIGTGAAGISAAEAIRSRDDSGEITLVSEEPYGYYSRPGLAYLLTGEIPEQYLFPFTEEDFRSLNVHLLHARITRVAPLSHQLENDRGIPLPYDRLLIATGSTATRMNIPGVDLEGVIKLDDLSDARRILKLAHKRRTAVVAGGGIVALEILEGMVARGVKAHYLLRGDRYWSNVLDPTESRMVEERLIEEGVQIHRQTEMDAILGKNGHVSGVKTKRGELIRCDLVGIAIGVQPRKELAEAAHLATDRGIRVNDYLETSEADIFAAGDVAQVYDPLTDKFYLDTLWNLARIQGHTAGLTMAGHPTRFRRPVSYNVTRLAGLPTTIIGNVGNGIDADVVGISRGDSETWRQLPDANTAQSGYEVNHIRIMVDQNILLGAVVMGDQTISRPLQELIAQKVDITPVRDRLLEPEAPLSKVITEFWTGRRRTRASKQS